MKKQNNTIFAGIWIVLAVAIVCGFAGCKDPVSGDDKPEPITIATIAGITAPVTGGTPVATISETAQYTGTVAWEPAVSGGFAASTDYTATITLTAKEGFTLKGVGANSFTVAGATATNAADSGVVTAVFPQTGGGDVSDFVAVTGIAGVPVAATAGTPLTLTGTVNPENATYKTIAWSIADAGTTGAIIGGNTLNFTAAGQATVTATIANGLAVGTPYTQNFTITVGTAFVPVQNIVNLPGAMTRGEPLTLVGTVEPENATNQTIAWSVADAGATGASIEGNTLSATATGTVQITATVANGLATGSAYTKTFNIIVNAEFVPVTGISGLQTTATAHTPLTLTGTVAPNNATNQIIAWSVTDAGTTGATIGTGSSTLNVTSAGTVQITATIVNGLATGTPYTQNFSVTVSNAAVAFSNVTAANDGSVTGSATALTLTFDKDIAGFAAADITLGGSTGATKGTLVKLVGIGLYELEISGITAGGQITVTVSKGGYTFTPNNRNVNVTLAVTFSSVTASSATATTSTNKLTLTFNRDITGFAATDITLTAGSTGATKGALTRTGTGVYELAISGVSANGEVTVAVSKTGYAFTPNNRPVNVAFVIMVTSEADTGAGTLRQAIADTPTGGGATIIFADNVKTIQLASQLSIAKSMIIQGNGVTLTSSGGSSRHMYISSATANVTVSRVWFKDGRATSGGAINLYAGTLTLESCIFSGNQNTGGGGGQQGGAIYKQGATTTLNVKGCTFVSNNSTAYGSQPSSGGAIFNENAGPMTLIGNLFYGNTAGANSSAVSNYNGGIITSGGYNVADVALGSAELGDKRITGIPVSPVSFKLLSGSGAANVITTLPAGYPATDFYGSAITNGAAAGAVQQSATNGYYLGVSVSNSARGGFSTNPAASADGLYSGTVTITATPNQGYSVTRWFVDGIETAGTTATTLQLSMTKHTFVRVELGAVLTVTDFSDATGSATVAGRLRYAMTNADDGDIIRLSGVQPGTTVISLTSRLPTITKSITIEGNGVTLIPSMTVSSSSQHMFIDNATAEVTISRVHFKDGRAAGSGVQSSGAAIGVNSGNLNLESCIFSGNQNEGTSAYGGAICIRGTGTLNVKGCTFASNNSRVNGGAIYADDTSVVTLTGNLFYGNTRNYTAASIIYRNTYASANPTITSGGYNVTDMALGTSESQSGWVAATGDKSIGTSVMPVSPVSFRHFSGSGVAGVITTRPAGYPATDFYGTAIANGAAAGAVQSAVSGYYLDLSVNNSAGGSVSTTPAANADGCYSGQFEIRAVPATGYSVRWIVDGTNTESTSLNTLRLTLTKNTVVRAIFERTVTVTIFTDDAASAATTPGTLRYALTNADDGDIIRIGTSGQTIRLTSRLPNITESITIEGNNVTITKAESWTTVDNSSQLMMINNLDIDVTIRRVWFKDGRANYGAAIMKSSGTLTLESCIFSGNQSANTGTPTGGAIYQSGSSSVLTLSGNLFYENTASTASNGPVVYRDSGSCVSYGYNVVDVTLGTTNSTSGFNNTTYPDKTIATILGDNATTPFANATTLAPKTELSNATNGIPSATWGTTGGSMPATDFYGNARTWPGAAGAVR